MAVVLRLDKMKKKFIKKQKNLAANKEMSKGDKIIMKWFVIPVCFVLPIVVLIWSSINGGISGGSNGVYCSLLESKKYNNTVVSCIYKCSKGSKSKTFYYTPIGSPSYCPGYPNSGYRDVEGSFIFKD
tara:strand:+ start:52 stop:435 length:384 start_codon:yes stop_codon:yes gene_type:complete